MNSSKKIMNQNRTETKKSSVSAPVSKAALGSAGSGPNTKAIVLGVVCVVLILVLCIGVGVQQFKPQVVLKVNDTKLTLDDMMYPIYERESEYLPSDEIYQSYFGSSIWDTGYMGDDSTIDESMTNSAGLKQEIINAETEYEVLYRDAVKADYKLTDEEKQDAEDQAKKALKGLSWSQKFQLSISKKKLTKRFEKRILADRYKEDQKTELNKKVDEEKAIADVSKKDLRQYDVQYYSFAKTSTDQTTGEEKTLTDSEIKDLNKQLKELAKKANTAKDFSKLLGDDKESGITFEKGDFTEKDGWSDYLSDANLKKVKKMKNGEISGVIQDKKTGYYMLIKMVDNNSTESYDEACEEAISNAQEESYQNWLAERKKDYTIKVYDSVWNEVTIGTMTTSIVTADDLAKMAEEDSSEASSESE